MIRVLMIGILIIFTSCRITQDLGVSPASLNQQRMVMIYKNKTEIGIHGGTDYNQILKVRVSGKGEMSIRGLGDCGFYRGSSFGGKKYAGLTLSKLPNKEVCIYGLTLRIDGLDSASRGLFILRRFKNPLIKPLKTKVNLVEREGVNWVQLKKDSQMISYKKELDIRAAGIYENRDIEIYPSGNSGHINIAGCGIKKVVDFNFRENQPKVWKTNLRSLYKGMIEKGCTFDILVNNRGYQFKEAATILVHVYNDYGSFLDAPKTYISNGIKRVYRCFKFHDPYVIGISVNGYQSRLNSKELCAFKQKKYEVIAITSKQRTFYGIYDERLKDWTSIK